MSKAESKVEVLVGCQAWNFPETWRWRTSRGGPTVFYPESVRTTELLQFYAKVFKTVEANTSVYGATKRETVESWYRQVPDDFIFSLKMPREVTHAHHLEESTFPIVEEMIDRARLLKEKAGTILTLLPAAFERNVRNRISLERFLRFIPDDVRFAIEFRARDWFDPEIFELLAHYNVAICLGHSEFIPNDLIISAFDSPMAGHAYFRFGGKRDLKEFNQVVRPQDEDMEFWFGYLKKLKVNRTFVYFSNFYEGHSPASAMKFRSMLGQKFVTPVELEPARSLF